PPPPLSTLFPYTTLFRSRAESVVVTLHLGNQDVHFAHERERRRRRHELEQLDVPEAEPRGARNGRRGRGLLLLGLALGPDLHFEALDAGLHPSEEEQAFGADGACADDARPPDGTAVLAQVRHVQRVRRERLPGEDTRPGQLADRRSLGEQAGRLREVARRACAGAGDDPTRGPGDPAAQVALRTAAPG